MAKICIDAGHGGSDPGAVAHGRKEKDDVLKLAKKIQVLLQDQGVKVVMTRTTDKDVLLSERTSLANKEKCDYFISLHRDAFSKESANGAGVWIYSRSQNTEHAKKIQKALLSAGFSDRSVKRGAANYTDYAVNRDTAMPACLAEIGFITNKGDNAIFDGKIDTLALELTKALCEIVGVKYAVVTSKPTVNTGVTVKEWQLAAQKDGFKFPKFGADGYWGAESATVATRAVCKRYITYRYPNLTKLVQTAVGVKADGKFGNDTQRAVIAYQKANKLTPDGAVGINTYKKILNVK